MLRIAAPMVWGMISATLLTLIVIPAVFLVWNRWLLKTLWNYWSGTFDTLY